MKKWLPSPLLSGMLLLLWLILHQNLAATTLFVGIVLAITMPLLTRPFFEPVGFPRMKLPLVFLRLLGMATVEVVRSCFNVSRIILFAQAKGLNSQFIRIPLDLRDPYGLALLSCLVNLTPGTVWVEILDNNHELALHVFDLQDEQWWIDTIKTRYEKPLIDIFE